MMLIRTRVVYTQLYLAYFVAMGLHEEEASDLHLKYYKQYGLALRGLVHHHEIGNSPKDCKDIQPIHYLRSAGFR